MAPFLNDETAAAMDQTDHLYTQKSSKQGGIFSSTGSVKVDGSTDDQTFDLLCVGFGPASLAIAIALHDANYRDVEFGKISGNPRVCFLEKQPCFRWHAGMLLPGSKMQISFLKDLATLRDPTSKFTFLNYLKSKNRLVQFTNLGTFLPTRIEFEDYLQWCAGHFSQDVKYGQEVTRIKAEKAYPNQSKIDFFTVESLDCTTGKSELRKARHIVIAIGGRPNIPAPFPRHHSSIIHSSRYCSSILSILSSKDRPPRIAIVGSGQSAAEIFDDLQNRYPNSKTSLIIRGTALRPSDDSPFVNEIFDPERVDDFYLRPLVHRTETLQSYRSTNYGVVRLELLENLYKRLYQQSIQQPNKQAWQHRILSSMKVIDVEDFGDTGLRLTLQKVDSTNGNKLEFLDVDAVIVATGYVRDAHDDILKEIADLNPNKTGEWHVERNYKLALDSDRVNEDAGIWLQGSNENSHGISDTLLSILATRSGEIVQSIFGNRVKCS